MSFNKLNDILSGKTPHEKDEAMDKYHKEVMEKIHGKKPDSHETVLGRLKSESEKPEDEAKDIQLPNRHPLDWKKINRKLVK